MTIRALMPRGIDLNHHRSRAIGPSIRLADLILTATNQQVREVVAYEQRLWPRTFTLRDLVRRGETQPRNEHEGLSSWLQRVGQSRTRTELLFDGGPDDVADPTGGTLGDHLALATELNGLLARLSDLAFANEDGLGRP